MMDEARSQAPPLDCHDERGDGEFGTQGEIPCFKTKKPALI
jgi:hypothetical protein